MKHRDTENLSEIARSIVSAVNPLKVVLMGSHARGNARSDSDIDLLVIGDPPKSGTWSRRKSVGDIRRKLPKIKVPVDILFFTPEEVSRWKDAKNHVIHHALTEGTILYERR
jgi:predicted nucleotidyltransferase